MSYESLERELERRQERRTKGDKKSKRKSFPYRRGGRKGSKVRTKLNSENWSGDEESPLAKALAAARERANIVKPQLNIKNLPHRNQKSLTDFEADTRWISSYPGERPPWCSNRNPRAIVKYPCNCGECDAETYVGKFAAQEYGTNCDTCGGFLRDCIGHTDGETCNQAGVETRLCTKCEDDVRCDSCRRIYDYYGGDNPFCDVCSQMVPYNPVSNVGESHKGWCKWDAGYGQTAGTCETCWSEPWMWSNDLGYLSFNEGTPHYNSDIETMCLHCMEEDYPEAYEELINQIPEKESKEEIKSKKWWKFWNAEEEDDYDEDDYGLCSQGCPNDEVTELCEECDQCRDNCCVFWDCFKCKGPVCVNERFFEENLQTMKNMKLIDDDGGLQSTSVCTECLEDVMNQISEEVEVSDPPTPEEALRILASGVIWRPEDVADLASDALNQTENDYKWVKYLKRFGAESFEAHEGGTNMSLPTNQLKILKYLGQFHPNLIDNWDPPAGLTQSEIAKAVGQKSRTGVINPLNRLIEMGLVVSRQKRPPGARRVVKVFFPTWEGHELVRNLEQSTQSAAETHNMDIEYWETQAHENTLTGLSHEDIHSSEEFRAKGISHLKPSQIKEKATEILVEFQKHNLKGMWLQELTNRINATLPRTRNVTQGYVSKSLGKSIGGRSPFYITSDGRVFNHRGQDRGEFIKGVI